MRGRGDNPLYREVDINRELAQRAEDQHQKERAVLFENETLAVKVLQAVSGGSLIAAISQATALIDLAGRVPFLIFVTAMALALLAAVFAIHWKHQYKMWDVKAAAADEREEAIRRWTLSGRYLAAMRSGMWVSLLTIFAGFVELIAFFWITGLRV